MDYNEILKNARECSGPYCKACPVCNGMACRTQVPGPGGKGTAATMLRNYQKWQEACINMDTICENAPIDTTFTLFGRKFAAPIFAAPVGAMKLHYGDKYDDLTYNDILVSSCAQAGIAAFTGDGTNPAVMEGALHAITAAGGLGVPTVKPWNMETVFAKLALGDYQVHLGALGLLGVAVGRLLGDLALVDIVVVALVDGADLEAGFLDLLDGSLLVLA